METTISLPPVGLETPAIDAYTIFRQLQETHLQFFGYQGDPAILADLAEAISSQLVMQREYLQSLTVNLPDCEIVSTKIDTPVYKIASAGDLEYVAMLADFVPESAAPSKSAGWLYRSRERSAMEWAALATMEDE